MPLDPAVSFITEDASIDSTAFKTVVVVGQSNSAAEGLYKNLEFKTQAELDVIFGTSSHINSCLKDVLTEYKNSFVRPKLWAISYVDLLAGVARVLSTVVSGTATVDKTLLIKLNTLNPDRTAAQTAGIMALRNTKGADCSAFSTNSNEIGSIVNARRNFKPKLANAFTNDVIIEVDITSGMTSAQVATAINTAINAKTTAIYSSSVAASTLTITSKHKGSLSNFFSFEIIATTIPSGISFATTVITAGTGVVDATGILDITDTDNNKLKDLDFNFLTIPYGYSVSALVSDAAPKFENVLEYNNQCLEYYIIRGTALDLSNNAAIDALASAEPTSANGISKLILVSELDGLRIKGTWDYTTRSYIKSKQFTPIQREQNGNISIGVTSTLSNSTGFTSIERVFAAYAAREFYVEKAIPADFSEADYTTGDNIDGTTYNRDASISKFKYYRDILDGTVLSSIYGDDYANLIDNNEQARARHDELLEATINFDTGTKQLFLKMINQLINPINSISVISQYS